MPTSAASFPARSRWSKRQGRASRSGKSLTGSFAAAASGWLCGYSESFLSLLGSILPVFLAIYVIVYLCVFFAMKQEAKKINKSLGAE